MGINTFLKDKRSSVIFSLIFGMGVISFVYACTGDDCKSFVGPSKEDLDGVFRKNGQCLKYEQHAVDCDKKRKTIPLNK
tara:strand:+ start:10197 stop:10433 length:237 start_codon:yes stop_codon:yes gene_type:complete